MDNINTVKKFRSYVREELENHLRNKLDDDGFYSGSEEEQIELWSIFVMVKLTAISIQTIKVNVRKDNMILPCYARVIDVKISHALVIRFQITPRQRIADIAGEAK